MADNITLNAGSGGVDLRTDDDGTAHWQYVKLAFGADNTQTIVGSTASNPLPVALSDTDNAVLDAIAASLAGTLTVGSHAVTNAGTFAVQQSNAHTADFDTGAGTDTTTAFGIAVPANGGAAVVPGDATAGLKVDLGADNDVTITGTVTVDNGGTFAVQAAQSGTWNVTNISGTVSLPTGAATAANQSTIIGHVDGIETLLGTIDADTSTLAGAVAGSEMQVDIVSGTVTANLGATDNAVLDNIDTNTSPGASHYRNIDANAEDEIKGSAGTLHWIHAMNLTAAKAYLHLYDATAASVTPGTTTPTFTFALATQGDTNGAGFTLKLDHAFANGITLVCTTTLDGSAGDPGTNGVIVNAGYT